MVINDINDNFEIQPGYVIILIYDTKRLNLLSYTSYKCRRAVQSVLEGQKYTIADALDDAYSLLHDINGITGKSVPLTILTDSEFLFKTLFNSITTQENV